MAKLVQCVPNYSEGRDLEKVEKIALAFKKILILNLWDVSQTQIIIEQ